MPHSPAGPLMHEHRVIERTIGVLDAELRLLQSGSDVNATLFEQAVDFMRTFADRCHHGKEEDILFERLSHKQLEPHLAEMMQGLIDDHVRSRILVRQLAEANMRARCGDTDARSVIIDSLREIVSLYPRHIETEDKHFFRPAIDLFTSEEREQMVADFEQFEQELLHHKYGEMVEDMERAIAEREPVTKPG